MGAERCIDSHEALLVQGRLSIYASFEGVSKNVFPASFLDVFLFFECLCAEMINCTVYLIEKKAFVSKLVCIDCVKCCIV